VVVVEQEHPKIQNKLIIIGIDSYYVKYDAKAQSLRECNQHTQIVSSNKKLSPNSRAVTKSFESQKRSFESQKRGSFKNQKRNFKKHP
jgi:hypothetical protein